jgi:hypothetical protein
MFPAFKIKIKGLDPKSNYFVMMGMYLKKSILIADIQIFYQLTDIVTNFTTQSGVLLGKLIRK